MMADCAGAGRKPPTAGAWDSVRRAWADAVTFPQFVNACSLSTHLSFTSNYSLAALSCAGAFAIAAGIVSIFGIGRCPAEPFIPWVPILNALLHLMPLIVWLSLRFCFDTLCSVATQAAVSTAFTVVTQLALLVLLIAAVALYLGVYVTTTDYSAINYCHPIAYYPFAILVVLIVFTLAVLMIACCVGLCLSCYSGMYDVDETQQQPPNEMPGLVVEYPQHSGYGYGHGYSRPGMVRI